MSGRINPPDVQNTQNVFVPELCRFKTDSVPQQLYRLWNNIIGCYKGNIVIQQCRPKGRCLFVMPIRTVYESIERWCVDIYFWITHNLIGHLVKRYEKQKIRRWEDQRAETLLKDQKIRKWEDKKNRRSEKHVIKRLKTDLTLLTSFFLILGGFSGEGTDGF